jgi:hypothetical protein
MSSSTKPGSVLRSMIASSADLDFEDHNRARAELQLMAARAAFPVGATVKYQGRFGANEQRAGFISSGVWRSASGELLVMVDGHVEDVAVIRVVREAT